MSEDYLWDKSGEPDAEIEQLEQLLGDLRYRRPNGRLPLPERPPAPVRRTFRPAFAIAAAVLFMTVAAGVWFALGVRNQSESAGVSAINAQTGSARDWLNPASMTDTAAKETSNEPDKIEPGFVVKNASLANSKRRSPAYRRRESPQSQVAKLSSPNRLEEISEDEGVAAREQWIKALHLARSKLNQVQKKIQDNKALGPVS